MAPGESVYGEKRVSVEVEDSDQKVEYRVWNPFRSKLGACIVGGISSIPIVEDARQPMRYRMLVGMVDVIFSDVAQPDQARIVALNAHQFLKTGGGFLISVKASCVDSTATPEAVYAMEIDKLKKEKCKPKEQLTLEPYHRDHALVAGVYRAVKKK